jgi:hypothetical protein
MSRTEAIDHEIDRNRRRHQRKSTCFERILDTRTMRARYRQNRSRELGTPLSGYLRRTAQHWPRRCRAHSIDWTNRLCELYNRGATSRIGMLPCDPPATVGGLGGTISQAAGECTRRGRLSLRISEACSAAEVSRTTSLSGWARLRTAFCAYHASRRRIKGTTRFSLILVGSVCRKEQE